MENTAGSQVSHDYKKLEDDIHGNNSYVTNSSNELYAWQPLSTERSRNGLPKLIFCPF